MRRSGAALISAALAAAPASAGTARLGGPAPTRAGRAPLGGLATDPALPVLHAPTALSVGEELRLPTAEPPLAAAEAPILAISAVFPPAEEAPLPAAKASLEALAGELESGGSEPGPRAAALETRLDGRARGREAGGALAPAAAVLALSAPEPAAIVGAAAVAAVAVYLWMRYVGPGGSPPKAQRLAIRRDGMVVPAPEEPRPSLEEAVETLRARLSSWLDALGRRVRRLLAWRPWRGKSPPPPPSEDGGPA